MTSRICMPPVFRFAPSPNGYLHLGHALSALLNHDRARAAGGRLLLRIEDIDAARCRPEYEAAIYEDLQWLGIECERAGAAAIRAFRRIPRGAGKARRERPRLPRLREPRRDRPPRRRARRCGLAARSRRRAALSRQCPRIIGGRAPAPHRKRRAVCVASRYAAALARIRIPLSWTGNRGACAKTAAGPNAGAT